MQTSIVRATFWQRVVSLLHYLLLRAPLLIYAIGNARNYERAPGEVVLLLPPMRFAVDRKFDQPALTVSILLLVIWSFLITRSGATRSFTSPYMASRPKLLTTLRVVGIVVYTLASILAYVLTLGSVFFFIGGFTPDKEATTPHADTAVVCMVIAVAMKLVWTVLGVIQSVSETQFKDD